MKREKKYYYRNRHSSAGFQSEKTKELYSRLKNKISKRSLIAGGSGLCVVLLLSAIVFPGSVERVVDIDIHEE